MKAKLLLMLFLVSLSLGVLASERPRKVPYVRYKTQDRTAKTRSLFNPSVQAEDINDCLYLTFQFSLDEGGNLAASKIRNLECPSYEICLIDYGCGKFNRKIHIMEQYP